MPDDQRDFFISFNSADEAYAKAISDALRAEGLTTFFHPDDLEVGGYIPKWMNDALLNSRQMLALCSPEYMDEGAVFSEAERYARFWQDTRGQEYKIIPVVLKDIKFPPLLAPYKRLMATNTTPAAAAAAVIAALKKPEEIRERGVLGGTQPNESVRQPAYIHTTLLPETGYERLVGRDAELERLDKAWLDAKITILSLIAEGGAGKSALVNEWIKRMQAHNYPGAETVLGWSFFSQGTAERATSAEEFLDWAVEKLGLQPTTNSASAKADAIAEAMMRHRVLLLLDGVEPLQHGPGPQLGQLKDLGLRALLRRFAATPPGALHGLIVLTSRLALKDITRWQEGAAPVVYVDRLSDEAGAALLRDNGVLGIDKELKAAAHDFGGHPLALGLLASFLKETQTGDIRRRDHVRAYLADKDNPRHDHAKRVMESYEEEWLAGQPLPLAIMRMVGLFDRPATGDCLNALRAEPAIEGLMDQIIGHDDAEWQRAVTRLREVHLLAPSDSAALDALDAHPLVREWFGERLRQTNEAAWKAANSRLYKHLRDTTMEGTTPTLEDLAPLYQAIVHGCRAGLHYEALIDISVKRICRLYDNGELEHYATVKLGAYGSELAAIAHFFDKPYSSPNSQLPQDAQRWVLGQAAEYLISQGRIAESLSANYTSLRMAEEAENWSGAAASASNLSGHELLIGAIDDAIVSAQKGIEYGDRTKNDRDRMVRRAVLAYALCHAGRPDDAKRVLDQAQQLQKSWPPTSAIFYLQLGFGYFDLLLGDRDWDAARDRAAILYDHARKNNWIFIVGRSALTLGRAYCGLAFENIQSKRLLATCRESVLAARIRLDEATEGLRAAGTLDYIPLALLARATFRRKIGDWDGAARDLDEVEEIAEPGPMRLFLCDMAIKRANLALARSEAFAPLNGLVDVSPPKPQPPDEAERKRLQDEAAKQLAIAADLIERCGYHRSDEELAELLAVLRGERTFASLPLRV